VETTTDTGETLDLLRRAGAGDQQAFDQLFSQHRPFLRQVVELRLDPKLRARVDASDVVQEVHLEVFRRLADYLQRQPMPFRLWLRQTADKQVIALWRRHVGADRRAVSRECPLPGPSAPGLDHRLAAAGSTPSRRLHREEMVGRVRQALAGLPEVDREVLLMRTFEGLSYDEVSRRLGIEPAAARKRHGRAVLRLDQLLAEAGLTESQV
jgi:RNA polymerase sigma-70 factor (ECF subfamily)